MKILLIGGAGYIGSHVLLSCLEAGHDAVVLDNFSNSSQEALTRVEALTARRVSLYEGDVRDAVLLDQIFKENRIDVVIHFAGLKAVGASVAQPLDYYDANVGGSVILAKAMAKAGVRRIVFSSTASIYSDQKKMPVTEASIPGEAASTYARPKRMVEQVFEDLCSSDRRWSVAILRYFNPVGAHHSGQIGEDPLGEPANLVPYAMQVAMGRRQNLAIFGDDYPTPDGTSVRDYIHVMDLAEGHLAAMSYLTWNSGFGVWNLVTGRGHSVLEVVRELESITGKSLPKRTAPRRPGDTAQCWADPTRAAVDLSWKANRGLSDMLGDHWRWQEQNPEGY